jgi:hypothetical protein
MMRVRYVMGALALASVVLLSAVGSARAADKWSVLGKQTLNSTETTAEIKGAKGLFKEDIKATKLSVEGADVEIQKVVLHWNNRPDETVTTVGVIKAGGQSNPKDAPGRESTLKAVTVQYKILNNAPTATVTLWGLD